MPYKDPTRPIVFPHEYLIHNDDYLTHANVSKKAHELSPYFRQILTGPVTDSELSFYTTLVQNGCTHPELRYFIANFSTFLLNKQ